MKRTSVLTRLQTILERRRNALRRSVVEGVRSADLTSSPFVGDSVDQAIDAAHGEITSQLVENESRELAAVENALERLAAGEYGQCEECGKPIPTARLQALPYATLCIECQRNAEVGATSPTGGSFAGRIPNLSDSSDDMTLDSFELSPQ
jgi:DnaK suppressor protein